MKKLTLISISTESCFFVVFTYIGLIVKSSRAPHKSRGSNRTVCTGVFVPSYLRHILLSIVHISCLTAIHSFLSLSLALSLPLFIQTNIPLQYCSCISISRSVYLQSTGGVPCRALSRLASRPKQSGDTLIQDRDLSLGVLHSQLRGVGASSLLGYYSCRLVYLRKVFIQIIIIIIFFYSQTAAGDLRCPLLKLNTHDASVVNLSLHSKSDFIAVER
mmetsp:Transcript_1160/g.1209  ORF Transcript_1160/g.1209 Transcript_1160/m.1209 type:complete len:217 (-) Transcript_1160:310-960(-)